MSQVLPLVYFTHAELKSKENLKANLEMVDSLSKAVKKSFESGGSSRVKKRLKLTLQDENMSYEAFEEDEQPFVVGVLDKSDGNVTVCNTPYFLMKPNCYISAAQEKSDNLTVNADSSFADKLNSLTAAFGSSKKRKAMQTKLKNKIDIETLETVSFNSINLVGLTSLRNYLRVY